MSEKKSLRGIAAAPPSVEHIVEKYQEEVLGADALSAEANVSLIRTFAALSDALNDYFVKYQLTRSRYNVLRFIYQSEERSLKMSEIGAGLSMSKTNVTSLVDRLDRMGLISRRVLEDDRRSVYVELTPAGLRLIRTILPEYLDWVSELWSPLGEVEKASLVQSLGRMRSHLLAERVSCVPSTAEEEDAAGVG